MAIYAAAFYFKLSLANLDRTGLKEFLLSQRRVTGAFFFSLKVESHSFFYALT
jgi:hypothetical protein